MKRYKIYTGPTIVDAVARHLDQTLGEVFQGTEHVYLYAESEDAILQALQPMLSWTKADIREVGS